MVSVADPPLAKVGARVPPLDPSLGVHSGHGQCSLLGIVFPRGDSCMKGRSSEILKRTSEVPRSCFVDVA